VYLIVFHAYINEIHATRSKIPSKKSRPYIYVCMYEVKFLALREAPYTPIYDINRIRVKRNYLYFSLPLSIIFMYKSCIFIVLFYQLLHIHIQGDPLARGSTLLYIKHYVIEIMT
jgi:hypothetical protein